MTTPLLHRPAGGSAPVFTPPPLHLHALVNRPVLPRPTIGLSGLAPDAITDFLASLIKQHESVRVIFPAIRRL